MYFCLYNCYNDADEGEEREELVGRGIKSPRCISSDNILLECFCCIFIVCVVPSTFSTGEKPQLKQEEIVFEEMGTNRIERQAQDPIAPPLSCLFSPPELPEMGSHTLSEEFLLLKSVYHRHVLQ